MSRRPAINDAEPHIVTSHGADFFGQDRHPLKDVAELAPWVSNSVSFYDRGTVSWLVRALERPEARTIPAADVALVAELLLKISRSRGLKPKHAAVARLLADAATRAAADGEPWEWTTAA
ncbi:hypothetical protein [Streptomyces sp. cg35]|uniref:DUF7739 domain-containing protein n=1 Tax=Streptomyces sp. cg35 TaxID=3421650 RepID=UPI003D185E52